MTMREYSARFASEMPFYGVHGGVDGDGHWSRRFYEGRLGINRDKLIADLSTPNGIPIMFNHGGMWGDRAAVGRILEMDFSGSELLGVVSLSEADVVQFIPGGFDALDAGINAGLSIAFSPMDESLFLWTRGEGTAAKPDKLRFGPARIYETSLTPTPRIRNAGLLGGGKSVDNESPAPSIIDAQ